MIKDENMKEYVENALNENKVIQDGYIKKGENGKKHQSNTVYDANGLAPTLTACDYKSPLKVIDKDKPHLNIKEATKKGYKEAYEGDSVNLAYPESTTRRGRIGNQVSQTLQCNDSMGVVDENLCIRKLTPKECYRLMGFSDELFNKIEGVSNTQLYKQVGNSIVTDVLFYIYIELYKAMPEVFDDLKVLSLFSGIGAFEVGLDRLYRVINLLEDKKREKQGEK